MNDLLTARQVAEVDAYIHSPKHRAWERAVIARWNLAPGAFLQHLEKKRKARKSKKNASAIKRYAATVARTPAWADLEAMRAIYAEARRLSRTTGTPHHVDHEIPLQGRIVSGLHVHNNLQILTGSENSKKRNHFEVAE